MTIDELAPNGLHDRTRVEPTTPELASAGDGDGAARRRTPQQEYDVAIALYCLARGGLASAEAWEVESCDFAEELAGRIDRGLPNDDDRERLAARIGWLEQGIRLAVSDLERLLESGNRDRVEAVSVGNTGVGDTVARRHVTYYESREYQILRGDSAEWVDGELERIREQLRKTIEGPTDGVTAGTSRELGPCYPGSPDDERGPL